MTLARLTALAVETVEATQRKLPPEIRPLARAVPVHYEAGPAADLLADAKYGLAEPAAALGLDLASVIGGGAAADCGVAAGPAKYTAGSPGNTRVRRNVTITTPIKVGITVTRRLKIVNMVF